MAFISVRVCTDTHMQTHTADCQKSITWIQVHTNLTDYHLANDLQLYYNKKWEIIMQIA